MHPARLRRLFDEFGHRMLQNAWRGDVLMERGFLSLEELCTAVQDGYFVPQHADGTVLLHSEYCRAGTHFAVNSCYYKLTAKGWWTGIAIGASFEDPRSRDGGMADAADSKSVARKA